MIRCYTATFTPAGADGSATGSYLLQLNRPGFVRALSCTFASGSNASTVVTVNADSSTGAQLFTRTSGTTLATTLVAAPAIEEAGSAAGADDVGAGGFPFAKGLYVGVTGGNAKRIDLKYWVEL